MSLDLVVASGKGGVGKSLITSSILYLLRERFPVVGVDADAPAPNLHIIFGVDAWDHEEDYIGGEVAVIGEECIMCNVCVDHCIYEAIIPSDGSELPVIRDYLCEGCRACGYVCPVNAITYRQVLSGKLRKTSTNYNFPLISAELDVGRPNSGKLVADERKWARDMASKNDALVVIDSAAGIGCEVIASMSGANIAVLVAEPTDASLSDMKRAHYLAEHFGVEPFIVINKSTINSGYDGIKKFAEENDIVILGEVPYDEAIPQSLKMRKPMLEVFPESEAAEAIKNIVEKLEKIIMKTGAVSTK